MVTKALPARPTLDVIQIASPCNANWDEMTGDDRQRHCQLCHLNVYNLSDMSRADAEAFLTECEDRVCIKLYRRHDGTVITKDCPVGLAAVRAQVMRIALATAGLLLTFAATALAALDKVPFLGSVMHYGRVGQLHMQHSPMMAIGSICLPPVNITTPGSVVEPEPLEATADE